MSGRVENLPKWAQRELEALQRQAADLRRENDDLRAALAGNGAGRFSIEDRRGEEDITLPDHVRSVMWTADDGFELRLYTDPHAEDLRVMCTSWHGVVLRPEASNVVVVGRARTR